MHIDERLIDYLSTTTVPPQWMYPVRNSTGIDHIFDTLFNEAFGSVSPKLVEDRFTDPRLRNYYGDSLNEETQQKIRKDLIYEEITRIIAQRRANVLCLQDTIANHRAIPYEHEVLRDITVDKDYLVALKKFKKIHMGLGRKGYVFEIIPSLPSINSSYWLMQNLFRLPDSSLTNIRLDPFLISKQEKYAPAFYKAIIYGRNLDWERINNLRNEEHAEWTSDHDSYQVDSARTQIIWTPRDQYIHFECEELPVSAELRPARYAHAIYNPQREIFIHSDGAVRYYTQDELNIRRSSHLRKQSKVGNRIKIFRTDGNLPREDWSHLIVSFFVWNDDIVSYFEGKRELSIVRD